MLIKGSRDTKHQRVSSTSPEREGVFGVGQEAPSPRQTPRLWMFLLASFMRVGGLQKMQEVASFTEADLVSRLTFGASSLSCQRQQRDWI